MATGIELIAAERERQVTQKGLTPEHDDRHDSGELTDAARGYAELASEQVVNCDGLIERSPECWPWGDDWWKPSTDPVRNLVKAGALIAAEIGPAATCLCLTPLHPRPRRWRECDEREIHAGTVEV